jgi:FKBP-type peptidyl-prolyl cis-trans isomerase
MIKSVLAVLALGLAAYGDEKVESKDIKVGEGTSAEVLDVIQVHYVGTFKDGKEFDSSVGRNKPFQFQLGVGMVIKGWDEGVLGMKVGGERDLKIPFALAYGDAGIPPTIPPKSDLNFNVKLISIMPRVEIKTLTKGFGEGAGIGDDLNVDFEMTLMDGTPVGEKQPGLGIMIRPKMLPCINQGLFGIKEGESREVKVPAELAFGDTGFPPRDSEGQKAGSLVPPKAQVMLKIKANKVYKKKA